MLLDEVPPVPGFVVADFLLADVAYRHAIVYRASDGFAVERIFNDEAESAGDSPDGTDGAIIVADLDAVMAAVAETGGDLEGDDDVRARVAAIAVALNADLDQE